MMLACGMSGSREGLVWHLRLGSIRVWLLEHAMDELTGGSDDVVQWGSVHVMRTVSPEIPGLDSGLSAMEERSLMQSLSCPDKLFDF